MMKRRLLSCFLSVCLLLLFNQASAQNRTITGVVTNETGSPLEGATVMAKGQTSGVTTDATGTFRITVANSVNTLVVTFVGFEKKEIAIGNQSTVSVSMQVSNSAMDAVVVVGYGTQKRKDVTGAIASVKGADIKNLPVTNVAEALQGRVAGVEVIKSSGEPGAPVQIVIRGVGSLNQPQPLYIVDGIRQSGENINVQDIASIDILKDASAASIYGSAAAGGVIIITTKKGQGVKPTVNFSVRHGLTTPRVLDLLNRDDFIRVKQLVLDPTYSGQTQTDTLPDTDWVDEIFRNGVESNYSLSISGSSPVVNYFISGLYNNQKGVFIDNKSSLAGIRANTDIKLGNRIKIGEQLYAWQRNTDPVGIPPINPPFRSVPTMSVYGKTPDQPWGRNPGGFVGPNLVAQIKTADRDFRQINFQGNVYAEIKLPLSLTFRTTLGYTYYNEESNYFQDAYNTGAVSQAANSLTKRVASTATTFNNYILSFDKSFDRHTINALIGYEQFANRYNAINTNATAVGGSTYAYLLTSESKLSLANGGYDPNGLVKSTFGRINYDYDKKYYGSFSLRRDGNFTVFGPGNQYGVFPSGSVGWNLGQEQFIKSLLPDFNLLKLRASYGVLGNSNIPAYLFLSNYEIISAQSFEPGGVPVLNYTQNNIPNPNIKWESMYATNIGLDGEVANGKIYFSLDWYDKRTEDMLYQLPIPPTAGMPGGVFFTNIGSVRNRGFELLAGYKSNAGQFYYNVSVNAAFNKNKVLNLDDINNNPLLAGNN
ncbi:MAG TPA: SusC/RagA family TonB-linked outer membrane protein, partial [Chitinophagaceae bacterium]|nr:SusC/RagA family TonB-linked outer membrane protein [Chitinophagaceae bacterium]